ncbi:hypothetical protein FN976_00165 [Caenimonas sedimenti]|uniref:Uncharacterized protein n=1 Tax=Caenimonas sedimenti TaxID=2596921 RepID=A0A562ZXF3_9BURK|nr:hypothetical protein [Caenimonas sedimenti]TWO73300.1 hypothetical protein FN976_00165 [Caenimonas sedimenti]
MKAKLRPHVAALLLLIPGAATLTALPAAAQQRAVVGAPAIQSIALNADDGLSPGSVLQFNVQGTPDARNASVTLAGSNITVPLSQERPGSYRGTYTVRRADRIDPTKVMQARLQYGNQTITRSFTYPPGFQALAMGAPAERTRDVPRDQRAPSITNLTPANADKLGERGRVHISATLGDEGSGVDPASVRLRVNGLDVTSEARVSPNEVNYRENLPPGRHSVEVRVKDVAGNMTTKSWGFDVLDRDEAREGGRDRDQARDRDRDGRDRDRMSGGSIPLRVTSPDNGGVLDANRNLFVEGRTAPGATVRVQVEAVSSVGGVLGLSQPVADQTVRADRDGHFVVSIRPSALPLPGTRFEVRLTANDGNQTAEERITVHQRQS